MRLLALLLVITITFFNIPVANNKANAAAPVIVILPGVAITALEAMSAAAVSAAAIGLITANQNQEFQAKVDADIQNIKTSSSAAIDKMLRETVIMYKKIMAKNNQCDFSGQSSAAKNCSSPEECCGDFFKKFSGRLNKSGRGVKIFKQGSYNKVECCMEWDYLHSGYEIFDNRGNHMGERGCDDLTDDPCEWTSSRGKHAEPASNTHKPRTPTCTP